MFSGSTYGDEADDDEEVSFFFKRDFNKQDFCVCLCVCICVYVCASSLQSNTPWAIGMFDGAVVLQHRGTLSCFVSLSISLNHVTCAVISIDYLLKPAEVEHFSLGCQNIKYPPT